MARNANLANGDLDSICSSRGFFSRVRGGGCSEISFLIRGFGLREIARVGVAIYEMLTETANSGGRGNLSRRKLDEDVDVDSHLGHRATEAINKIKRIKAFETTESIKTINTTSTRR